MEYNDRIGGDDMDAVNDASNSETSTISEFESVVIGLAQSVYDMKQIGLQTDAM